MITFFFFDSPVTLSVFSQDTAFLYIGPSGSEHSMSLQGCSTLQGHVFARNPCKSRAPFSVKRSQNIFVFLNYSTFSGVCNISQEKSPHICTVLFLQKINLKMGKGFYARAAHSKSETQNSPNTLPFPHLAQIRGNWTWKCSLKKRIKKLKSKTIEARWTKYWEW